MEDVEESFIAESNDSGFYNETGFYNESGFFNETGNSTIRHGSGGGAISLNFLDSFVKAISVMIVSELGDKTFFLAGNNKIKKNPSLPIFSQNFTIINSIVAV